MPRVQNLQTGRNKVARITGLKEFQQKVDALKSRAVGREVSALHVEASQILADQAIANLKSVNAPHEVAHDLFIYGKDQEVKNMSEPTALMGLRKHGMKLPSFAYREWNPGRQVGVGRTKENRTRKKGAKLIMPGTLNSKGQTQRIGENLGTMWELGTSKMAPKPWWRPALMQARPRVFAFMVSGYQKILKIT